MGKTVMTIKLSSTNDIQLGTRRSWNFMPASKSFKSIRDYNRRADKIALKREVFG